MKTLSHHRNIMLCFFCYTMLVLIDGNITCYRHDRIIKGRFVDLIKQSSLSSLIFVPRSGCLIDTRPKLDPLAHRLIKSWVDDLDSLRKTTIPLTIDQVHSITLFTLSMVILIFPLLRVFIFHGAKQFFWFDWKKVYSEANVYEF